MKKLALPDCPTQCGNSSAVAGLLYCYEDSKDKQMTAEINQNQITITNLHLKSP